MIKGRGALLALFVASPELPSRVRGVASGAATGSSSLRMKPGHDWSGGSPRCRARLRELWVEGPEGFAGRLAFPFMWFAMGALFTFRISTTVVDLDLFHQMALIREWRALGSIPRVDLYAFTPTVRLMHHEWGAGALGYAVAVTWGGTGILLLRFALGLTTAVVAVRTALRLGAPSVMVAPLAPIAMLLVENGYPPVRAHAYSFLLLALMLHICERDREGTHAWVWALVPLFVAWVNLHAGCALGMILLAVYAGERAVLQRGSFLHVGIVVVAILAAVSVNPYGLDYYAHLLRSLRLVRSMVPEWEPIWYGAVPVHQKVAFWIAVGLVGYGLAFGRRTKANGLLLVAATAGASAFHHRMLPFFGTAWIVYCPALLHGTLLHQLCMRIPRHPRIVLGISVAASLLAGVLIWSAEPLRLQIPNDPIGGNPDAAPYYPVGAVSFLREQHFRGNLLTPFNQGSYVLWKLYPDVKVSLDSRYEAAYEPALAEAMIRLYQTGEGLPEVLERYRPDALLVPRHSGLARAVIPFGKVYEDASFAVYARPEVRLAPAAGRPPVSERFP